MIDTKDIYNELENRILAELVMFADTILQTQIQVFDIGCFPWHGKIELSILTTSEFSQNPTIKRNVADWKYYNFSSFLREFPDDVLGKMREMYEKDSSTKEMFFNVCTEIVKSPKIHTFLKEKFNLDESFSITSFDPDDEQKGCEIVLEDYQR